MPFLTHVSTNSTGTVLNICSGCGIQTSVQAYETHSTTYALSQPGLGSVWRAILAYDEYQMSRRTARP